MEIWFFLPFGALAPKTRRIVVHDPPERPDLEPARAEARRRLATRLNPRLLKDIGLGDD
jgi:hypothetical protein